MKFKIAIVLLLFLFSCSDSSHEFEWYKGTFNDALYEVSNQKDKILFLDFYSDN